MAKVARTEAKDHGRKAAARKEAKDKRKAKRERPELVGHCGKTGHTAAWCKKGGMKNMYALDEDDSGSNKESTESEEDLQAWCILEESESEQWQQVIIRKSRLAAKRRNQASLSSVETSRDVNPKIVEEKDRWVKVRVTMDSGAAGHVMPEVMFPHVKIERKTSPKKFVAANGKQIKDLAAKRILFKTNEDIQRRITFRSAMSSNSSFQCKRSSKLGTLLCWMKRSSHDETGPVFSWQGQ